MNGAGVNLLTKSKFGQLRGKNSAAGIRGVMTRDEIVTHLLPLRGERVRTSPEL